MSTNDIKEKFEELAAIINKTTFLEGCGKFLYFCAGLWFFVCLCLIVAGAYFSTFSLLIYLLYQGVKYLFQLF